MFELNIPPPYSIAAIAWHLGKAEQPPELITGFRAFLLLVHRFISLPHFGQDLLAGGMFRFTHRRHTAHMFGVQDVPWPGPTRTCQT
ncbi:MAG: hypothetical protein CO187_03530 [Zetaproteobacteria bacterium CG_4_9_14_3_um_filter_53_7]|nr:MAG: hypothetical protein CO187_03530 [Zetaproteobacteria bacterium CG_4_9_14_3_um_filter_53_7]